jgi:hypothetical protein
VAKTDFTTGTDGQSVHGRTTAGSDKSQVVVIGTDGSNAVLDPATLATQTTLAACWPSSRPTLPRDNAAAILAKLIASPATEATLASVLSALAATLATRVVPLTSATPAQVASSATAVTLQASNANRRQLVVVNDSTAVLYLKYGSGASATSYSYKLAASDTWEMPLPAYTGIVTGIWASANGFAYATAASSVRPRWWRRTLTTTARAPARCNR